MTCEERPETVLRGSDAIALCMREVTVRASVSAHRSFVLKQRNAARAVAHEEANRRDIDQVKDKASRHVEVSILKRC